MCLEGDESEDRADSSVCLQLNQISALQYLLETFGSIDHQHVLRQAVFFLVKRTLKQEFQVKETSGKRDQGEFYRHDLLHHQAVLHYTFPLLPLNLLLIIIILLLLLLILLLLLLFTKDRHLPPPPPGSKILTCFRLLTSYKIVTGITRLRFSDLCNPDRTKRTSIKTEKELKNQKQNKKEPKTKLKRTKKNL